MSQPNHNRPITSGDRGYHSGDWGYAEMKRKWKAAKKAAKKFRKERAKTVPTLKNVTRRRDNFQNIFQQNHQSMSKKDNLKKIPPIQPKIKMPEIIWQGDIQISPT